MADKRQHGGPVPPGNQSPSGPPQQQADQQQQQQQPGAPFSEQDPKRRLGNYEGAGEHPFQQPGGKNDADR